jgi:predicted nuclease with TOPRIM domain
MSKQACLPEVETLSKPSQNDGAVLQKLVTKLHSELGAIYTRIDDMESQKRVLQEAIIKRRQQLEKLGKELEELGVQPLSFEL